nr:hypothetical protein [Tanacetum cinerariifolium]
MTTHNKYPDKRTKSIYALYNILKQNQGDVNDAMRLKKKTVVVTSDPLALIAEKTNMSRSKEKVVVSSDSEGSEADDFNQAWMESRSDSNQEINANTCFECGVLGHYKSDCPKLKNGNQGNRAGNGNAVARAYAVGTAETNPNSNVVT